MSNLQSFESVWDALEDDPIIAENMKLRSMLLIAITKNIESRNINQTATAELLEITQPRVSALLKGKIEDFRLDTLVNIAHRLGLHIDLKIAA
ncbi:MAG: helix-turn-helix domain-containing protein [Gammaproteobacteria bacterium]|nr:helix-turn-helix domain-containing protein [Gammaproteobacteria bacterium]